jgi:hypothetical protein
VAVGHRQEAVALLTQAVVVVEPLSMEWEAQVVQVLLFSATPAPFNISLVAQ